ncbi:hypothetical protein N7532_011347 [Penicillium argentinense]|uniref:Zn(2)-C6 fungal-type domain-containing protein n=1 Tax=Penicillium argentinense TaxID=1131581 RepID=A0A9W9JUE4_9EURO|nr:uncharacterized protein N7532_011347 [Penicillium argentinense]KAJ5082304.1 hypothetical protein N7532_011347 [Penicillium argentinense]
MDTPSTARRTPATGGSATANRRRRIRPSRARGLRTKTGCLTCRERRVKCDDVRPTCLRCSKSDRLCRYADDASQVAAAQVADQHQANRAGAEHGTPRTPSNTENCVEEGRHGENGTSSSGAIQEQRSNIGTAPYFHAQATSGPVEASGLLHTNTLTETPQQNCQGEATDQRVASLDSGLAASPFSLNQISLLNISPFEWYDLLARDAIINIQRQKETSADDSRWRFPEIALSRRQSPTRESSETQPGQARRQTNQQRNTPEEREGGREAPLLEYQQMSEPWNTADRIKLSAIDVKFFRYYIEVVGPILDLFDPSRHFSNVVPHLALRNIGLLKSILAVGAKHMSLGLHNVSGEDVPGDPAAPNMNTPSSLPTGAGLPSESDTDPAHMATQYYYETLQYLSQTLLYPSYADSHEILATATMISTYEMFDADSISTSGVWEQHLRGSFWIQRSQDNDGESVDGFRQAVWWAWLRQDIWAAFQAGRPTLTFWRAKKKLEDLNPDEIATRIVYICGKCVAYAAAGDMSPNQDPRDRIEQGDRLLRALDEWNRVLPASYQPVTFATSPGSSVACPPIWIHPPNHAGAMQMYHFARAIVLLSQPTMGGLGAYLQRDKQLAESVKTVCGIANACQEHESAMAFVNVQALFGVGQFVRSPEMRDELLRTLNNMLRISKFPPKGLVARLKQVWQE